MKIKRPQETRVLMASKNLMYFTTPHRLNQTSFQSERKRKGESKREKRDRSHFPPSLHSLFSLFFSPLLLSLLPSIPSCLVFRLSSLREWSTIKDLIKTPEQAKALWQYARPGSAGTGRQAAPPIRPPSRAVSWGLSGGGRG